jgi:hypothetical protein
LVVKVLTLLVKQEVASGSVIHVEVLQTGQDELARIAIGLHLLYHFIVY